MGELIPIIAILTVFGVPAAIIIVWNVLKHRERMGIMKNGFAPGIEYPGYPGRAPLLWGMILTAVSTVGIVLALIQYDYHWANLNALILSVGIALLIYWKVTAPHRKQDMEFYERRCHELNTSAKAGE
jgi:hypothetical protein